MAFIPHAFENLANSVEFPPVEKPFVLPEEWSGKHWLARSVEVISLLAIPFVLRCSPSTPRRGVPVYEEFVEGAKEGFQVAIRIIPFLVAILVAVGCSRGRRSGSLGSRPFPDLSTRALSAGTASARAHATAQRKRFNGIFAELVNTHGPDSLIARMGATVMGSTETTFYVIAVYFGSVAIRRTRHAVAAGLIADLAGVIASVVICILVFG